LSSPLTGARSNGLPLNLEKLLRDLQDKFGDTLGLLEMIRLPLELHRPRRRQRGLLGTRRWQPPPAHRPALRERGH